jgi:two-component system sensor histidine kinase AlgZ
MSTPPPEPGRDLFLPDFCGIRMVFALVVVGELLAIVLTLHPGSHRLGGFPELALTSLFVQWVALGSAALLCLGRRVLERLGNTVAATCACVLILGVTLAVTEAAYWLVLPQMSDPLLASVWEFSLGDDGLGPARPVLSAVSHMEFLGRNLGIAAVVALVVLRYFYVQHQWKSRIESESRARIQALQSRIRPHFLFNSMNTIASLTRSAPAVAEQVTEDLAALFRVSLGDASVPGTLAQELEVCRQYLRIEAHRLGERLASDTDTDGLPGDALLPALTLQPLLENAVYHGVEPAPDGGHISLRGRFDGERIVMSVENSLPAAVTGGERAGNAMALDNVHQRVEAFFAGDARLRVTPGDDRFRVDVEFPYRKRSP